MKTKLIHEAHGLRTFAVVLDMGDEVSGSLQAFAEAEGLSAANVAAIGAFESATLAFWDWDTKAYRTFLSESRLRFCPSAETSPSTAAASRSSTCTRSWGVAMAQRGVGT